MTDGAPFERAFRFAPGDGAVSQNLLTKEFVTIAGELTDGRLVMPQVPGGPYYFKTATDFVLTSEASIDTSLSRLGRDDRLIAAANTNLMLNITGLTSWGARDALLVYSTGANAYHFGFEQLGPVPSSGATTIMGTYSWSNAFLHPVVQASKGDQIAFIQMGTRTLSSSSFTGTPPPYVAAINVLKPTLNIASGGTTSIAGTMTRLSLETHSITVALPEFEALERDVNPNVEAIFHQIDITADPPGTTTFDVASPDLMFSSISVTNATTLIAAFSYGNPMPSNYTETALVQAAYDLSFTASGAAPESFRGVIGHFVTVTDMENGTQRPRLSPPRAVKIAGRAATASLSGVGLTPELAWDGPSIGTPRGYVIDVFAINNTAGKTTFDGTGRVLVRDRKATLPPGLLSEGRPHVIRVRAIDTGFDSDKAPYRSKLPVLIADTVTGAVTP